MMVEINLNVTHIKVLTTSVQFDSLTAKTRENLRRNYFYLTTKDGQGIRAHVDYKIINWRNENCQGLVYFPAKDQNIFFELQEDAIAFKLMAQSTK